MIEIINSMNQFMFEHLVWSYYIFAGIVVYPVIRVFKRAGFDVRYAGMLVVPLGGIVLCSCFLALRPWPAVKGDA